MKKVLPRIVIGGSGSGCGKTTVVCAILKAIKNRGIDVSSFKCGPDYIDVMLHSYITGRPAHNIDFFTIGERASKYLLSKYCGDINIIEGVMGFYDGLGSTFENSSCHISNAIKAPAVIVVNPKGMAISVAALINGFAKFRDNNIKAVILNCVTESMYKYYKNIIEQNCCLDVCGFIPYDENCSFESRHLGLVTDYDTDELCFKIDSLGKLAERYIDIDYIIELSKSSADFEYDYIDIKKIDCVNIAVSKDRAFRFIYDENIELLKSMGANIIYFSPIDDCSLPGNIDGVYICGGYPELYAQELSANNTMIESVRSFSGPIWAECGGFMYLNESICFEQKKYGMVGIINGSSYMTKKLNNFGYYSMELLKDSIMGKKGSSINIHEFHYSKSDALQEGAILTKNGSSRKAFYIDKNIFAGFPHINLWGNTDFAYNFIKSCKSYQNREKFY